MMRKTRAGAIGLVAALTVIGAVLVASGSAAPPGGPKLTNVATANPRVAGLAPASKLSVELRQTVVAQGATQVENPSNEVSYYGYTNDVTTSPGVPQMLPTPANPTKEAHKTEPDKNTYLVFPHSLSGADSSYGYGTHFLFQ